MSKDQWKRDLQPYAEIVANMETSIRQLPPDELADLAHACHQPTPTNCWYAIYSAAAILRPMIEREVTSRARTAEQVTAPGQAGG